MKPSLTHSIPCPRSIAVLFALAALNAQATTPLPPSPDRDAPPAHPVQCVPVTPTDPGAHPGSRPAPPAGGKQADTPAPQFVTLQGTLHARMSSGGESTGWSLTYQAGDTTARIDVCIPAEIAPLAHDGALVEVTGEIRSHEYLERGSTRILYVTSLRPILIQN